MTTGVMSKKVHVLCEDDTLCTAIELKLSTLPHVNVTQLASNPAGPAEAHRPTDAFDLFSVAPVPSIRDPLCLFFPEHFSRARCTAIRPSCRRASPGHSARGYSPRPGGPVRGRGRPDRAVGRDARPHQDRRATHLQHGTGHLSLAPRGQCEVRHRARAIALL